MSTQRALAVVAAVLFVGAVGLATVGPRMILLSEALSWLSANAEAGLHNWLVRVVGPWSWNYVAGPLLIEVTPVAVTLALLLTVPQVVWSVVDVM